MLINEIFSSIQGEGIYCGYRQIFLRLSGCNLSCDYCDEQHPAPVYYEIDTALAAINELNRNWHHSISITGGEPLLQVDRLKLLLPSLPLPVYLETNGTLPDRFAEIREHVDIVSLDCKPGQEKKFFEFLQLAKDMDVFIKYVLLQETNVKQFSDLLTLIAEVSCDIPFVIQPVTPHGKVKHSPSGADIMKFYQIAKKHLSDVRAIPQLHKIMKVK